MSVEINQEFAERLEKAIYIWFTTIRADGMPQPTPVWFVRDGDTFLIYTTKGAQKLRNIAANPKVALNYSATLDADDYLVIMGEARFDPDSPAAIHNPAYMAKYGDTLPEIGMTPEEFNESFSEPIRVTPTFVRGD